MQTTNRPLTIIQCVPDDFRFYWETHMWLESLRNIGLSDKTVSLVFTPYGRQLNTRWKTLETLYPEAKFVSILGTKSLAAMMQDYIPLLRPYCLQQYFKRYPELEQHAIFYCDSDTYYTEKFDISHLLDDDVNYLSDTKSYISASYFDSKVKDVLPHKLEKYRTIDVLQEVTNLVGISREIAEKNNDNSGGAQYLLKNITYEFWQEILENCLLIGSYLKGVNKEFFANENKGIQTWCRDMWAVLWNLWKHGRETKVVSELDFAWSTDVYEKVNKVGIFHNAGLNGNTLGDVPVFYKGKYVNNADPFKDPNIEALYTNDKTKQLANYYYIEKFIELKRKYNY